MSSKKEDAQAQRKAAMSKAEARVAEQAAQLEHQRHILDLGDRAVEVVAGGRPGVWHVTVSGHPGPGLHREVLAAVQEAEQSGRAAAGRSGRPEDPPAAGVPVPGKALTPMEEYLAVMSEPAGLTAFELSRLVPDQPQGTCLSCRMKLTARDGAVKCAWCLTLDSLSRPAAGLRPAWPCKCDCPSQAAHEIHIGVRPVPVPRYRSPGMAAFSILMAVAAWCAAYYLFAPFIIAVIVFAALALVHATGKRRPRP